jgi:hypothetical protein
MILLLFSLDAARWPFIAPGKWQESIHNYK